MPWIQSARRAGAVVLAAGCLSLAAGCRREPHSAPPEGPPAGGTLRLLHEAPASLDPVDVVSVYESLPVNQLYEGLVRFDAGLTVRPELATTWEISRDGCRYVFHLRDGVRFHDGSPMTAEDVVHSLRRALDPERSGDSIVAPYLAVIRGADAYRTGAAAQLAGVRAVDRLTVEIELEHAYSSFLEVLAMDGTKVVPHSVGARSLERTPIGTGPFTLESWDDARLVLAAFEDWHAGRARVDRVEIVFAQAADPGLGDRLFRSDRIDAFEPDPEEFDALLESGEVRVARWSELSLSFLGLDTRTPPLDRLEVRQAIGHALDRRALVSEGPALRRSAGGILPPGMSAYSPEVKTLPHDPDRARRLLADAGYSERHPVAPIPIYTASGAPSARRTAERIAEDLRGVGLTVEIRHVGWSELTARLDAGTAPAFLLSWVADMNDPDAFLRVMFEADGPDNYFRFRDSVTEAMLDAGARELAPEARARIYRRLERRILEQAPLVPLYHSLGNLAVREGVHGIEPGPMGLANLELERVWLAG